MIRPLAAVSTAAIAGWAAPALLRGRALRTAICPRLAGMGRPDHLALTFDDGPDPDATPAVLEVLDRLGVTATFFMLGAQVARHPQVAAAVVAAGHEAAVHGFTHRNHLARGPIDVCRDVTHAASVVAAATGTRPTWFRPPYGVMTAASLVATRRAGLRPVLWTAWGRDWEDRSPVQVAATVRGQLAPGGTVLLHDSDCTTQVAGSWRATVVALPLLAELADQLGCQLGPLRDHVDSSGR
ncbi:MAG: polysaccharide deacetylase family protein [Pseudonocardiales bacterium]|nr:polysaccharide deacetylase family protein [Pseudonocardiales bacterium]MBV9651034.1 polysaccharide deacetylase family protein [Pseudonocardiales bacterium]